MASDTTTAAAAPEKAEAVEEYDRDPDEMKRSLVMRRREATDEEEAEDERDSELPIAQSVHIPAGEAEAVDKYENDPDEVIHSLVLHRRETSDEEEEETEFERRMN